METEAIICHLTSDGMAFTNQVRGEQWRGFRENQTGMKNTATEGTKVRVFKGFFHPCVYCRIIQIKQDIELA